MRIALMVTALAWMVSAQAEIVGKKPEYLKEHTASFANDQAVTPKVWVPALDEGYTPQGLAIIGKHALVSSYRDDLKGREGACRVFRVELATGKEAGAFDMPRECGHSGGVADVGGGKVVLADTRALWRIDVEKAIASGKATGAIDGMLKLGGDLYGSFAAFDGTDLWIGRYTVQKDAPLAKIHRLPMKLFVEKDGATIDESHVALSLPSPPLGQGMVVTKEVIWIGASSSKIGWLFRLDRETGKVLARYDTIIGLEGIALDAQGVMWGVSEAGAKKYQQWEKQYPLIFTVDTTKLK